MSITSENLIYTIEIIVLLALFVPTMIGFLTGAPWVPTPNKRIERMLELAEIKPGDRIYDLGCGDGRIVQMAALKYKADAIGIELSPILYIYARIRNFFLRSKAKIVLRDFKRVDFSNSKVLLFYLLPDVLKILKPKFEDELKPGTRLISYAFEVEGWEPIYTEPRDPENHFGRILVYEMPASAKTKGNPEKK